MSTEYRIEPDGESDRTTAREFLVGLKRHLSNTISAQAVTQWLQEIRSSASKGNNIQFEGLFLDKFVLPAIHKYLGQALENPTDERIREAFLAESDPAHELGLTSDSPRSANKYLFTKAIGANSTGVAKSWWDESGTPISPSCPDWAFRAPCPHTVVFEGKLFRKGGIGPGRSELVSGIYQCFYYRAHPSAPATKTHPAWQYNYACLFAYDASEKQSLVEAWKTLNSKVKEACWAAANIFVMVLPAEEK